MEDIYIVNYDCIACFQNFEYISFKYYINIRLIHKLFYFRTSSVYSFHIQSDTYRNGIEQLNTSKSLSFCKNIISLKITCNIILTREVDDSYIWKDIINLQKLIIHTNDPQSNMNIYDHQTFTNLTHLEIQSTRNFVIFICDHTTNLKFLKLHNVIIQTRCDSNSRAYFSKLTNLISLERSVANDDLVYAYVNLLYEKHSNLKYLKLENMKIVTLFGMTQLKTKILKNIDILKEC